MSETRTMTASEAANDVALWERVYRGEVRVTDRWNDNLIGVTPEVEGYAVRLVSGDYAYQVANRVIHSSYNWDEPLTIVAIPVNEQSENSPANVERLKARIAELEAQHHRLREFYAGLPDLDSTGPVVTPGDSEAPLPPTTSPERATGDYRVARGIFDWQPGDDPAEVSVRRLRDNETLTVAARLRSVAAQVPDAGMRAELEAMARDSEATDDAGKDGM